MRSKTVLDHVRPTVVVRRRIYDAAQFHDGGEADGADGPAVDGGNAVDAAPSATPAPDVTVAETRIFERAHAFLPTQSWGLADEDESGPPSSVNVARALASLRGDELKRLDELIAVSDEDEDDDGPTSSVIAPPMSFGPASFGPASVGPASVGPASVAPLSRAPLSRGPLSTAHVQLPILRLPRQISVAELARQMSVSPEELVSALVMGGFFTVKGTSVLPRETARLGAEMFGWQTDAMTEEEDTALSKAAPRTRTRAPARKKKAVPAERK